MGLEETVARLRGEVTAAQHRHASASAQAAQADARAATAREDLEAEFGVSTVEAAREKLAGLEKQLAGEVTEVQRQLDLAGGAA
jgi:predicted  nucleic acid-binding Zn-ribbon protein